MVHGENRAKIKKGIEESGERVKRLTIGVGKGITDFATGTVDAIFHPTTIPEKLETCFDNVIIQPTMRIVDFAESSTHKVLEDTDKAFNDRVKQARDGARHLKVVFAQPLGDLSMGSVHAKNYPKSAEDGALIEAALKENLVFSGLTSSKRASLVSTFEDVRVKHGTKIIEQGDVGDYFYVLAEGEVDFQIDGKVVGTASKGSSFGELALLYQAPRAATCVAKTQCGLFRLDQEAFKRFLAQQMKDSHADVIGILKKVPYFKELDEEYLNKISSNLRAVTYNDGDVLASREAGSPISFYIVKEGIVEMTGLKAGGSDYKDNSVKAGEFFGDYAIVNNEWSYGTAKAKGKVVVLSLGRDQFVRVLGTDIGLLVRKQIDKAKLELIPFGKRNGPAENELDLLVGAIKEKKFQKGHIFFVEGKRTNPALYLVRKGKLSIRSSNHPSLESILGFDLGAKDVKTIEKDGYFGNDTLGANEKGEFGLALYTVTALEDVEVGVLDLDAIRRLAQPKKAEMEKVGIDDLDMVRILGAGTFGKVWLVKHKHAGEAYALKIQVKKQLIEYNQAGGVIREKNIMALLDNPFIIKMVSSWKDNYKLYMLLKLYQGGELQSVIHTDTRDGIPEWAAVFYAANILEGLSYMHHRNIIYRDLKPENVLLDSDGYTVIVDLGFAKIIKDKTYTFCGTPLYLAPEIITQIGHDKGADHWSWGVLIYEMIVGMTPFYDGVVDQMGLFKNIVKCRMEFPEGDFMSNASKDLIKSMLTVNPNDRLGSFANADKDIKSHRFFNGIDWEKLREKDIKVPFKPNVSDPLDGSNFDDYSKLEAKAKNEKMQRLTATEEKLFVKF
eukprot:CAMPEP_0172533546 /NCGR_PEP_ID=MMETSP1067-20121228/6205_1 /TAXON_ID=265564 ORGANISM="Thalassiosira punctigera, Strain Tpunct2005C2" /NCGR_SAMPLE_ID=MMETSP1067 /ASSEMBLY_ACC=CAM_ASM_000444 /LENGTH=839 /DNA_ID=CAMNT_0013318197 /DNA_START=162 /DNA_END=2681 /DNA_ORIENTATION=+